MQELLRSHGREHLAIYSLATLANFFLSVPQYIAVNTALELAVIPKGTTASLIAQYGSSTGLLLDFLRSGQRLASSLSIAHRSLPRNCRPLHSDTLLARTLQRFPCPRLGCLVDDSSRSW